MGRSRRSSTRPETVRRPSNGRPRFPFSDGRVATYGFSYQGLAQLYAAARRPPSLRGIAAMMCCPDPYEGWTYEGGCLRLPFVAFWSAQLAGQERRRGPDRYDVGSLPVSAALGDDPPRWFTEWLEHPSDDGVLGRAPAGPLHDRRSRLHRPRLLRRLLVGHGPDHRRPRRGGGVRTVDPHALGIPPRRRGVWATRRVRRSSPNASSPSSTGCSTANSDRVVNDPRA